MKTTQAYETITQKIIDSMENGTVPWRKPWSANVPKNLFSGKSYRGVNNWLLSMIDTQLPAFATFNQVKQHGGMIKKGSKSVPVYFFQMKNYKEEKDGEEKLRKIPIMRQYAVFTLEDIDGIDFSKFIDPKLDFEPNADAQTLIDAYLSAEGIPFTHDGNDQAYYVPSLDIIKMPRKEDFKTTSAYYATSFHEIGHSTGHEKRLNRFEKCQIGSHKRGEAYSFEELVAELTSSYLCALTGIDNELDTEQSAAYIKSWLKVLKDDKAMIWKAAAQAQRAVDYITSKANINLTEEEQAF